MLLTNYEEKTKLRELILDAYINGKIDFTSVISRLDLSKRQVYRLIKRYNATKTLTHKLYGKPSNHSIDEEIKEKVMLLYKEKYLGFNYEHASELLEEIDNIKVSSGSLRKWLLSAKITWPKQKRKKQHLCRKPRESFNDMLQLDGTFGDFLGNNTMQCLMHLVDDATGTSLAYIYNAECTQSALDIVYKWCCKYGIPKAIYADRHSTYKVNDPQKITVEEELEGKEIRLTEFGKICEKLGIEQIFAYSPQAKGRVERKHYLYKDRFIKELKLHNFTTLEEANNYLVCENGFTEKLNSKFTFEAKTARTDYVLPTASELAEYFTINSSRIVRNDYTISYHGIILQLARTTAVTPRGKVFIKVYLDGTTKIFANNCSLQYSKIENYQKPKIEKIKKQPNKIKPKIKSDSPWRQYAPKDKKHANVSTSTYLEKMANFYD